MSVDVVHLASRDPNTFFHTIPHAKHNVNNGQEQ